MEHGLLLRPMNFSMMKILVKLEREYQMNIDKPFPGNYYWVKVKSHIDSGCPWIIGKYTRDNYWVICGYYDCDSSDLEEIDIRPIIR